MSCYLLHSIGRYSISTVITYSNRIRCNTFQANQTNYTKQKQPCITHKHTVTKNLIITNYTNTKQTPSPQLVRPQSWGCSTTSHAWAGGYWPTEESDPIPWKVVSESRSEDKHKQTKTTWQVNKFIYIYIYRERERDMCVSLSLSIYIYICVYIHTHIVFLMYIQVN